jgi:hypothetical protein
VTRRQVESCGQKHSRLLAGELLARCGGLLVGLLVIAFLIPAGASAAECTNTWTGPAEGLWITAENWSAEHEPTSSDVACIGSGKTVEVGFGTHEAAAVQGNGSLVIASTLKVLSSTEVSSIKNLAMTSGVLSGPATINISGSLNWEGESTMAGSGSTVILAEASGSVNMAGSYAKLQQRQLVNEGTFTVTSGTLFGSEGAEIHNIGTFNANRETYAALESASGEEGLFVNSGTFRKTSGTETSYVNMEFENKGTVDAQTGKLAFFGGGSGNSSSQWESSAESELQFTGGSFSLKGGSLTGAVTVTGFTTTVNAEGVIGPVSDLTVTASGTLSIQSGTLETETLTMEGQGILTGAGTLNISESFDWASESFMKGSGSTVILPEASVSMNMPGSYGGLEERHLVNEGTFTVSGGIIFGSKGAEVNNIGTFNANAENLLRTRICQC